MRALAFIAACQWRTIKQERPSPFDNDLLLRFGTDLLSHPLASGQYHRLWRASAGGRTRVRQLADRNGK